MLFIILALIVFAPMAVAPLLKENKQYEKLENTVDNRDEKAYSAYCKHFS